jgi:hypothetical protein
MGSHWEVFKKWSYLISYDFNKNPLTAGLGKEYRTRLETRIVVSRLW